MRLTWLGHASLKLESDVHLLYVDPYAGNESLYTPADAVLVSQFHFDHCSLNLIRKIYNDNTIVLGTPEVAAQVFPSHVLRVDEHRLLPGFEVIGLQGKNPHPDLRGHADEGSKLGFLIRSEKKTVYCMADSDFIPGTENLQPDVLLIPVGGTYTQGPREAANTAKLLRPKLAIPIHWGSIVGTRDDAEVFKELVSAEGFEAKILNPGDTVII